MIIAITSEGDNLNSNIDLRFGRCSYFAFINTNNGQTEFLLNPAKELSEGAGPAAVKFIASKKAEIIIAGEFGGKIKNLLESLNIKMQTERDKTISEIIKQF